MRVGSNVIGLVFFTRRGRDPRDVCTQKNSHVRSQQEAAVYKARSVASGETNPGILIMDFWLPEL